ncbi:MAG: hypothetical protein U9N51_12235 [Bacteroidota bacterium]|nr:hypothetical protein [Bacteroidota bacterium]
MTALISKKRVKTIIDIVTTIYKFNFDQPINSFNALNEELKDTSVVAKFATTASDGKDYRVSFMMVKHLMLMRLFQN